MFYKKILLLLLILSASVYSRERNLSRIIVKNTVERAEKLSRNADKRCVETGLMYNRYRYYDSNTGVYWSQDPIRLHGGDNLYAYVRDSNSWVDVFGLTPFVPKPVDSGSVFRGVKPGQPAFSPSAADLAGADHMPGISSKPKNNAQTQKFFDKMGADVKEIDVSKLSSLEAIQDGKDHVSLKPSEKYLADNNLTMKEALEDWSKGGDQHNLSKELAAACK
jgi:RHS repeat-associated protein